ncbi:u3 small nucleolar RNA-associated protein 11 [Phlegmacium glaucopus]|nr:u3 small nucleolar RNA-associated protein 11 [Phlegmacium glaucopus]
MTSSLRNSIHRRNHKERSQLAHRAKLGLLEKHADYVKRARDYHSKQDRLTRLKQKAAERNKDEFYFSMSKEKTRGGVHVKSRDNVALPTDIVKVLKTQDENYVRTMRLSGLKKIDKIKRQLMETVDLSRQEEGDGRFDQDELKILKDASILQQDSRDRKRRHVLFAGSTDEVSRLSEKGKGKAVVDESIVTSSHASPTEVDLGWRSTNQKKKSKNVAVPSPQTDTLEDTEMGTLDRRKRLVKQLSARLGRDRQLRYAEREFEMQRQLMGKGARKKIQSIEKVGDQNDEDEMDEDELDARKGKQRHITRRVDETTYKPRVYKWRLERKR